MTSTLITRAEAADMLHVTTRTIDKWRKRRLLNTYKKGGRVLFDREEIQRDLQTNCKSNARTRR